MVTMLPAVLLFSKYYELWEANGDHFARVRI